MGKAGIKWLMVLIVGFLVFLFLGISQADKNTNSPKISVELLEELFYNENYEDAYYFSKKIIQKYGREKVPLALKLQKESLEFIISNDLIRAVYFYKENDLLSAREMLGKLKSFLKDNNCPQLKDIEEIELEMEGNLLSEKEETSI